MPSRESHDFAALRAELELPPADRTDEFPAEVIAEAERVAKTAPQAPTDLTDVPFVTIDPPGSMDLDQAVHLERVGDGFRVRYAIADLGSVIDLGGAIDVEARRRGQTIYLPDSRVPLHPAVLSEGTLSLLPDQVRGAAVWTIDVGADGTLGAATVERARVRSVARLDYAGVQADADAGTLHPSIEALPDIGRVRYQARLDAGAIELALPSQEVVPEGDDWRIRIEPRTQADAWNAEISLLTGMAAARMMLDGGVGLLRTLPEAESGDIRQFMRLADRLGVEATDGLTPGQVLSGLDMKQPESLALATGATKLLRGAGYQAFDGAPPDVTEHAGIGGRYAHVTAPLRRLVDRFGIEVCLALSAGEDVDADLRAALPDVVEAMGASDHIASRAAREAVDLVEVWVMQQHRGDTFDAVVTREGVEGRPAEVMVLGPPVLSDCAGHGLEAGARIRVRVDRIDTEKHEVTYVRVDGTRQKT